MYSQSFQRSIKKLVMDSSVDSPTSVTADLSRHAGPGAITSTTKTNSNDKSKGSRMNRVRTNSTSSITSTSSTVAAAKPTAPSPTNFEGTLSESRHSVKLDLPHPSHPSTAVQVAVRMRPMLPMENCNEANIDIYQTDVIGRDNEINNDPTATAANNNLPPTRYNCIQVAPGVVEQPNNQEPKHHTYTFDHVFPSSSEQIEIYEQCITPLVSNCIEGYNATVLAYGQTGSGKTHTILGESSGDIDDVEGTRSNEGILPRALRQIFNDLENLTEDVVHQSLLLEQEEEEEDDDGNDKYHSDDNDNRDNLDRGQSQKRHHSSRHNMRSKSPNAPFEYQVKVQFLELYGEDLRDLLDSDYTPSLNNHNYESDNHSQYSSRRHSITRQSSMDSMDSRRLIRKTPSSSSLQSVKSAITLRENRNGEDAEVLGANQVKVSNAEEALEYLMMGLAKRVVGKTAMNAQSSRSHAIFTAIIQQTRRKQSKSSSKMEVEMKTSKIHFVDLSGSERVKRAMTEGKRLVKIYLSGKID